MIYLQVGEAGEGQPGNSHTNLHFSQLILYIYFNFITVLRTEKLFYILLMFCLCFSVWKIKGDLSVHTAVYHPKLLLGIL
jgi:hypothetical protein